ncbi:MAG: hypothetical protein WC622_16085 [Pedobacter sp.]|jgi:uncharacterized membrane protein YagU involved in acid resistance|uniref:hypothetical protein n=1 Tax=Pedobacter sp. TaxID=1411316 RepID=UPI0035631E4E
MNNKYKTNNSNHKRTKVEAILWAGFLAGTLDALAGITVYSLILGRMNIIQVLQWIASGVFGKQAFNGGLAMALVGNILHYTIAYSVTIAYFFAASYLPQLRKNSTIIGLLFGLLVWIIMNIVILPISNVAPMPFEPMVAAMGISWHMLLVGLPIVRIINKYFDNH